MSGSVIHTAVTLDVVEALFDTLPRSPFFVKDLELRYVAVNRAMVELCGANSKADMIGRTARDFFPEELWRRYEEFDRRVLDSARPLLAQLDHSLPSRGARAWLLFDRWPVLDPEKRPIGVVATSRSLDAPDRRHATYARVAEAAAAITDNLQAPLNIAALARKAGVSSSQLERDFKSLFGVSPQQYLTRARLDAALALLEGDTPVAEVALACGYADQSAFTRRFHAAIGMSPTTYRKSRAK